MPGTKAGLPSADVWNPRFLSLSATKKSRKMHKKKLCNMRELLRRHDLVGVVETHVDPDTAELFFFDKLQRNVAAPGDQGGTVLLRRGMAVGFEKRWAKEHKARKIQWRRRRVCASAYSGR